MTVKELREALEGVPGDVLVYVEAVYGLGEGESLAADEAFHDTDNNRLAIFV